MASDHNVVHMFQGELLRDWQQTLVQTFAQTIKEKFFMDQLIQTSMRVPTHSKMWFYEIGIFVVGFLWGQQQVQEDGERVLRVQALYIDPLLPIKDSIRVTRRFEKLLSDYAQANNLTSLGFYTRRQPDAFLRRLNRTAPENHFWKLDSYVITRKVETKCTTQK